MTVQEAIKKLRLLNELIGNNPNVLDVPYSKQELFGFKAGLSLAVEALQKQVPMKPKKEDCGFMVRESCPVCDESFDCVVKFCDYCGQRIEWSDKQ